MTASQTANSLRLVMRCYYRAPCLNTIVFAFVTVRRADVVSTTGHGPDIVYGDVDLAMVDEVRAVLPVRQMRRYDVYRQCCAETRTLG